VTINTQAFEQPLLESVYTPIFTYSQTIKVATESIERSKWVFDRLLLDPRYMSWFKRRALTRSLHHTTKIEGNTLREEQVDDILRGQAVQAGEEQIAEIENCNKAYAFIDSISDNFKVPIDESVICHINALILGDGDPILTPGKYRKGENWVRHYMTGKRVYTPPNQGDVPALMRAFGIWLRQPQSEINPVCVAGAAHIRLVEIHPFWDGNGRTARALSTLVLQRLGYKFNKLLALERHLSFDLPNYFNAINITVGDHFEHGRDITHWLDYFVQALFIEVNSVSDDLADFSRAMESLHQMLVLTHGLNARQVDAIGYATLHGGVRPKDFMEHTCVSHETARRDLQQLETMGFLRSTGYGRARKYLYVPVEERGH
jgi:Fic family protein